jgi:hypothetical protein
VITTYKPLEEIFKEHPKIKSISKYFNNNDFYPVNLVIISIPKINSLISIYGLFIVDKAAVKKKDNIKVKQDFIAYNQEDNTAIYYSGIPHGVDTSAEFQNIDTFGRQYGYDNNGKLGEYGVYLGPYGKYATSNHHYTDDQDSNLPGEPEFRSAVKAAIDYVLND